MVEGRNSIISFFTPKGTSLPSCLMYLLEVSWKPMHTSFLHFHTQFADGSIAFVLLWSRCNSHFFFFKISKKSNFLNHSIDKPRINNWIPASHLFNMSLILHCIYLSPFSFFFLFFLWTCLISIKFVWKCLRSRGHVFNK